MHDIDFAALMPEVAGKLLGDPNKALSNGKTWRFGNRGSLSLDLTKGVWHDHETGQGGGTLDLIRHKTGRVGAGAFEWLREQRLIDDDGGNGAALGAAPKPKVVATYAYRDEAGALLFQVVRFEPKTFRQRGPDGTWSVKGVRQVPYRLPELLERLEGATVFIVEGEKDADRLAAMGLCATTNAGGAGKWPEVLNEHFIGADVVIIPDADAPGREHAAKVARNLRDVAASVRIVELPNLPLKGDVSDWLDAGGTVDELNRLADAAPLWQPKAHNEPDEFDAASLLTMTFPPIRYVVEGYVVEGLTVLGGRPKLGKSWLALDFAIAVATGGRAIGSIQCEQGDVLYLALEDNLRRIQSRLRETLEAIGGHQPALLERLTFRIKAGRLGGDLMQTLEAWRARCADARLVIVDVLAKVRPQRGKGEGVYEYDYRCAEPLQQWAIAHGVAVVVVHHVRKAEAEDPLEMLSGSNGLSGAADTILVLARDGNGITLYGRGRDIEEVETAISRDDGSWRILGNAEDVRKSDERRVILDILREAREPMAPRDVAAEAGLKEVNVRSLLSKMARAGEIKKEGYGRYSYPGHTSHTGHTWHDTP